MSEQSKLSADGLEVAEVNGLQIRKCGDSWEYLSEGMGGDPDTWYSVDSFLSPFTGTGIVVLIDQLTDAQRLLSQLREELAQRDAEIGRLKNDNRLERCDRYDSAAHAIGYPNVMLALNTLAALESQQATSVERDLGVDCCPWRPESERGKAYMQGWNDRSQVSLSKAASVGGELEQFEEWFSGSGLIKFKETALAGWEARAALSPAGGGVTELPEELFDGMAVYQALERRDRTSPENVSDTLNALAKLIRARLNAKPQANSQEGSK